MERKFPSHHAGRSNDVCQPCHQPAAGDAPSAEPPAIPHPLEGRDDCALCHETGAGGAPQFPGDHAGRTNDLCQTCHQSSQAAPVAQAPTGPVPTPIALYPWAESVNSCYNCHSTIKGRHADISAQWERSIHAERNVACADCHGGNPPVSNMKEAMSPDAGYIGIPAAAISPALCASCHADVPRMRQYDLPTDQFALYQQSVHGVALLEKQDFRAPTCATCHGTHGAAPPGFEEVSNICGSCHSATQDYYLKSTHATGSIGSLVCHLPRAL